ncbi:MAG: ABC transporter substrate-binding protein [Burkholderiaceae bacterium]|nr:ABC transporter substrate-binding protein [Burkholderiaceae bacterium]
MDRRRFVATLASGVAAAQGESAAQPADRVARVGVLSSARRPSDAELQRSPWRLEMERLGWVEGRNLLVERRFADGQIDTLAGYARDLVDARVDVIMATADPDAVPVRKLTSTLPIVVIYNGLDPVEDGLIASFSRPGGNVTGVSRMLGETRAKRLELIKTLLPTANRVGLLFPPSADAARQARFESAIRDAARAMHIELTFHPYRNQEELVAALPPLAAAHTSAFLLEPTYQTFANRQRIADLAIRHRLPGVFTLREYAEAGGLMAYGPDWSMLLRQVAQQVDRILRGARPADLPMEQPSRFEFVINVAAAKAMGMSIPRPLLLRADELIG